MIAFNALIPRALIQQVRIWQAMKRYPTANISSPYVARNASIGRYCGIGVDAVISDRVTIGDYTYINTGTMVASGTIGKFCSIAQHVQIGLNQHPLGHLSTSPHMYSGSSLVPRPSGFAEITAPPVIGNDVWIGGSVAVMQGVTIGHGAVVGAGAVVTKDVDPYSIVGGVPARRIRDRFDSQTVERLLEWAWWDLPESDIAALAGMVAAGDRWLDSAPWAKEPERPNAQSSEAAR